MEKNKRTDEEGSKENTEQEEKLVIKRGAKSVWWTWFGSPKSDRVKKIICKLCQANVLTSSGDTSNLFHHPKMANPQEYGESQKIQASGQSANKYNQLRFKPLWLRLLLKPYHMEKAQTDGK